MDRVSKANEGLIVDEQSWMMGDGARIQSREGMC